MINEKVIIQHSQDGNNESNYNILLMSAAAAAAATTRTAAVEAAAATTTTTFLSPFPPLIPAPALLSGLGEPTSGFNPNLSSALGPFCRKPTAFERTYHT